jgi:hypothetical protein
VKIWSLSTKFFSRYVAEKSTGKNCAFGIKIVKFFGSTICANREWKHIKSPAADTMISYDELLRRQMLLSSTSLQY